MASDSMLSGDCGPSYSAVKIYRLKDALLGVAGVFASCVEFVNWLKAGGDREKLPEMEGVCALKLTPKGIWFYDECATPYAVRDKFAALGSGEQAALAALHLGLSPKDAVKVAAKVDCGTGGRIVVKPLKAGPRGRTVRSPVPAGK